MSEQLIVLDYEPRVPFIPYHQRSQRWAGIVAHRRCGKTVACVNDLTSSAVYSKRKNARYGYIAPFYRQAKEIAWTYLKDAAGNAKVRVLESALTVDFFNGAKVQLFGADNPNALRGLYFDGVIMDEYGDMRPSVWAEVVLPTLADRKGWATFIGTPKGKNHFYTMMRHAQANPADWFTSVLPASKTGIIDVEELRALAAQMTPEQYAQEFECSFDAAVLGTYYAGILNKMDNEGRLGTTKADYDRQFPVFVASDLGYTDSTAMWFWQARPDGYAIIDYEEHNSQPLEFYFNMLREKGYQYDTIWLPHDAVAKSLQTGRSTVEQFLHAEFPVRIQPRLSIQHGTDAARLVLPHCWFSPKTMDGVEALRAYRRSWDEQKKTFQNNPVHDWASHGSDAFRGFALVAAPQLVQQTQTPMKTLEESLRPSWNLDQLWDLNKQDKGLYGNRIN